MFKRKDILPCKTRKDYNITLMNPPIKTNPTPTKPEEPGVNLQHPMLGHILSLADPAAWQQPIQLADEMLTAWLATLKPIQRVYLVGCGSSLHNAQVGKYALEHIAALPSEAVPAFSFARYTASRLLSSQTLVVGISTTGGTQAVCDALDFARQAGSPTLAVTAQAGSEVTKHAQAVLLTGGHQDTLSVKTSSYVQALVSLYMLAIHLAESRRVIDLQAAYCCRQNILQTAQAAAEFLTQQQGEVQALAYKFTNAERAFVFGAGPNLGTAEEASLKLVEMAKIHSSAHDLENFLHGRLRQVDQRNPLFFIAPTGHASSRVLDFLTVTQAIHAPSVVLTDEVTPGIRELASHVLRLPGGLEELVTPLLYILPLHLFGYELAMARGVDPNARRYNLVPQNVRYGDKL